MPRKVLVMDLPLKRKRKKKVRIKLTEEEKQKNAFLGRLRIPAKVMSEDGSEESMKNVSLLPVSESLLTEKQVAMVKALRKSGNIILANEENVIVSCEMLQSLPDYDDGLREIIEKAEEEEDASAPSMVVLKVTKPPKKKKRRKRPAPDTADDESDPAKKPKLSSDNASQGSSTVKRKTSPQKKKQSTKEISQCASKSPPSRISASDTNIVLYPTNVDVKTEDAEGTIETADEFINDLFSEIFPEGVTGYNISSPRQHGSPSKYETLTPVILTPSTTDADSLQDSAKQSYATSNAAVSQNNDYK